MKTLKQYAKCGGCEAEIFECYLYQQVGLDAGLKFGKEHLSFFVIDPKTGKFIVPFFKSEVKGGKNVRGNIGS